MKEKDYSIQELCDLSGLPRRTIHFYTQQGILPAPKSAGLGARYGEEHRLRLLLVPYLRRQGLRLDDIRKKFEQHSVDDLQRLADEAEPHIKDYQETLPEATPPHVLPEAPRAGQTCTRYEYDSGVTILIPDTQDLARRQQFERLLDAASRILQWI